VIGAAIGAGIEIASQVITSGKITNWKAVGLSAAMGTIGGGAASAVSKVAGTAGKSLSLSSKAAKAVKPATKAAKTAKLKSVCFVEGTLVETVDGHVPIEEVQAGDYVYAQDPETKEKGLKKVVRTFIKQSNELVSVFVNGEEIVTTPGHPFYVPQKGWLDSISLRAGDKLLLRSGEVVIIEQVQHEILENPEPVYNFEVVDLHTYYVSESSVLVHNSCAKKASTQTIKKKKNPEGFPRNYRFVKKTIEPARKRYKGGISVNRFYRHRITWRPYVTHTIYRNGKVVHQHKRVNWWK
jgi:hypothetical protein